MSTPGSGIFERAFFVPPLQDLAGAALRMDPLLITCAALAFVATIKQTCEVLKKLRCAVKEIREIQELVEDGSQAGVVPEQVETLLKGCSASTNDFKLTETATALTPIIDRLRQCLSSINSATNEIVAEQNYLSNASSASNQLLLTGASMPWSSSGEDTVAKVTKRSITGTVTCAQGARRRPSCSSFCPCSCHAVTTITTGEKSRQAIDFTALSFITPEAVCGTCSETRCRKRSSPMLRMEYTFPPWLLMAWVSATIKLSLKGRDFVYGISAVFGFCPSLRIRD
ncbi:hypothetical protein A1O3_06258 [Capronia epimyces CBS 606.96]|uniref:Fungal N-terminal domain-containing protein n=1 Tax=Capronia epimyces CBS 606.96 TaxID=1182542 RepID=W9XYK2_9EURO|nr:uncharacterized protein A1O3_06258 [Capronia epimyces CBS 606.96]EXJ82445.1 hypothetical protein A1O3_06258 [Capronia epimyces CBS 606.96]